MREVGSLGLAFPVIVKPNYEGSSKGIGDDAVARDPKALAEMLPRALRKYPTGVLVEEFIAGTDVTVPFVEGLGDDGVLLPVDYVIDPAARSRFNIYDYRLKSTEAEPGPGALPAGPAARRDRPAAGALARWRSARSACATSAASTSASARTGASTCSRSTRCRRWSAGASLFAAAAREGLDYDAALGAIVASAARRQGLDGAGRARRRRSRRAAAHRLHLQRQARRLQGGQRRRGRVRRARDHRRRSATRSRATATS